MKSKQKPFTTIQTFIFRRISANDLLVLNHFLAFFSCNTVDEFNFLCLFFNLKPKKPLIIIVLHFTVALTRFAGVVLRFTGVFLRFAGVVLRFTGMFLRFAGVVLRFAGVVLRFAGVLLCFAGTFLCLA